MVELGSFGSYHMIFFFPYYCSSSPLPLASAKIPRSALIFTVMFLSTSTVDIISAIEFDKSGDHLATGDRGGRVVLFERTDSKEVKVQLARTRFYVYSVNCYLKFWL